jgi:glycosyltransferase involved in cell wall biosynthesis
MLIDVVLPCLNEAAALPWVLARMPSGYRPIVADNGSQDGSAAIAASLGAAVVHVPQRGFGAACHGGLLAATADVVCFMDADGSLDPADLPLIAGPVADGTADLVMGRRRPSGCGGWPLHARLGNRVIAAQVRRRTGIPLRDIGPMRAVPRAGLLRLGLRDRRFGYPLEMVVRAAEAGWRVSERDVPYRPRTGRSKVTGTVGGTLRTVRDMSRVLTAPSAGLAVLATPSPDDQAVPAGPAADDQVTVPAPPAVPPPGNGTAR